MHISVLFVILKGKKNLFFFKKLLFINFNSWTQRKNRYFQDFNSPFFQSISSEKFQENHLSLSSLDIFSNDLSRKTGEKAFWSISTPFNQSPLSPFSFFSTPLAQQTSGQGYFTFELHLFFNANKTLPLILHPKFYQTLSEYSRAQQGLLSPFISHQDRSLDSRFAGQLIGTVGISLIPSCASLIRW